MKIQILFQYIFIAYSINVMAYDDDEIHCNGLVFHQVYFDKELIKNNLGRPYNLVMHRFSGLLFFSHTIDNGTSVDFGIMACQVEKKNCKQIDGLPGGYAVAYDPGNDDIYFGGHDGIYKYSFLTRSAEFFAEEGKSIWGLFVRRNFYYIEYPSQKLYVYQDDRFVEVAEAVGIEVDNFYVSKIGDVYFSNRTALFKIEKPNKEVIVLDDEIVIRQIVEDSYGDIYLSGGDGIYLEERPYRRIKKVAHIDQAFGMTFDDHDRVVYSDKDSIYRLMQSKNSKMCYDLLSTTQEKDEMKKSRTALLL